MSHLLIIFLSLLVALKVPAAASNRTTQAGAVAAVSDTNDPVDKAFKRLMEQDDEAQAEVDKWIRDNNAFVHHGVRLDADGRGTVVPLQE